MSSNGLFVVDYGVSMKKKGFGKGSQKNFLSDGDVPNLVCGGGYVTVFIR